VGIFGPSGSGKSTLLHCMTGLTQAPEGSVNMLGNELTSPGRSALSRLQRAHAGFVFQSFCLIDSLNVADNVALPSWLLRRSLPQDAAQGLLTEVGLGGRGKERIQSLSGGEQQR
jgi:putative ABC transport system ATP-binding protein